MRAVAPFGFYGWGNIGDEATLQGFARLVATHAPNLRVWVGSRCVAHTAAVEPSFRYFDATRPNLRSQWARATAQAHLFAGGTPIMDGLGDWPLSEIVPLITYAHAVGAPVVFVASGAERLHREASRTTMAREVAPRVTAWTVRSEKDRERLESYGVSPARVTVTADLAWLLPPSDGGFGRMVLQRLGLPTTANFVGVNINAEHAMLAEEPQLFEKLARALDRIVSVTGDRVLFLCNEVREDDTFDKAAAERTMALMNHRSHATLVPNDYLSPGQMMSLVAQCRFTISSRYHFNLFSALQGVPFVALSRSDKVADLCWDVQWPYARPLRGLDETFPDEILAALRKGRTQLSDRLEVRRTEMKGRADTNHTALQALAAGKTAPALVYAVRKARIKARGPR